MGAWLVTLGRRDVTCRQKEPPLHAAIFLPGGNRVERSGGDARGGQAVREQLPKRAAARFSRAVEYPGPGKSGYALEDVQDGSQSDAAAGDYARLAILDPSAMNLLWPCFSTAQSGWKCYASRGKWGTTKRAVFAEQREGHMAS